MKRFLVLGLISIILGCKQTKKQSNSAEMISDNSKTVTEKTLTVALTPKSNSNVSGTAVFTQKGNKVLLTVHVSGLTMGQHAIHLHEKADCSSADGTSTGGHWNPTFENHGKWGSPEGFHRGDIGNLTADQNGNAHLEFETDLWCIGCDDETKNIIGKAVIIHAATDDFVTQPTGNAGGRISCGGIIE